MRAAPVVHDSIAVTLPVAPPVPFAPAPSRAVWTLARASGKVALVPENLAQVFDRVDFHGEQWQRHAERVNDSAAALSRFRVTIGTAVKPGASLHLTPAQREQVLEALATNIYDARNAATFAAAWKADSQAVLDGVSVRRDMEPYILRAQAALPAQK